MLKLIHESLQSLNNSKFFAGIVMIMLNIGSKYITIELSKNQKQFLENSIARQLLIFSIIWMGTRDIYLSLGLTASFIVLTEYLFNEESALCVLPPTLRTFQHVLDKNNDNHISDKEIQDALNVLEKVKRREHKRTQLQMLNTFK
jgi:hypothetical protein